MQGLTTIAVTASVVAAIGLPAVALRGADELTQAAADAEIQREECAWFRMRVEHYRLRLMQGYDDPADERRERDLLMFYERSIGQQCTDLAAGGA